MGCHNHSIWNSGLREVLNIYLCISGYFLHSKFLSLEEYFLYFSKKHYKHDSKQNYIQASLRCFHKQGGPNKLKLLWFIRTRQPQKNLQTSVLWAKFWSSYRPNSFINCLLIWGWKDHDQMSCSSTSLTRTQRISFIYSKKPSCLHRSKPFKPNLLTWPLLLQIRAKLWT